MTDRLEQVVISGLSAWAKLDTPNQIADAYTIDIILDKTEAKRLKDIGLSVRKVEKEIPGIEDPKYVITAKRKTHTKAGKEMTKPAVLDSKKRPFSALIGNGSKVKVVANPYKWTYMNKSGVGLGLEIVQVIDLVEFGNKTLDLLSEEDGYVATSAPSSDTVSKDFSALDDDDMEF